MLETFISDCERVLKENHLSRIAINRLHSPQEVMLDYNDNQSCCLNVGASNLALDLYKLLESNEVKSVELTEDKAIQVIDFTGSLFTNKASGPVPENNSGSRKNHDSANLA